MDINRMLLKQKSVKILEELEQLETEIRMHHFEEAENLRSFLREKRNEADRLDDTINQTADSERSENSIRKLKQDCHTALRRWRLLLVTRFRRDQKLAA